MRRWLIAAAVCLCAAPAPAQDKDADGSRDHPMFSRMPGYYIEEYDAQDFSSFELDTDPSRTVEGRYWKISYWLKEGAKKTGPVQLARNYIDLMTRRGGRKLYDDVDSSGGTAVAQMPADGRNIYLQIGISNSGEVYDLYVVEEAAMEQKVELTAMDNAGQAAANLTLSRDRAAAVKEYLVQTFAIPAARLTTSGFGDTRPVAPNTAETGRAQNRRVELVKR